MADELFIITQFIIYPSRAAFLVGCQFSHRLPPEIQTVLCLNVVQLRAEA